MYILALVISGICWFFVAGVLGQSVPIFGEMWLQHLTATVVTSIVIGYMFKKPVMTWEGLQRYVLPFLTLLSATTLFGLLLPLSWWVTATIRNGEIDGQAFYLVPAMFVLYSMTVYIVVLYPLAFLTQTLLRKFYRDAEQALGADSP